jgi:hypothetical protein
VQFWRPFWESFSGKNGVNKSNCFGLFSMVFGIEGFRYLSFLGTLLEAVSLIWDCSGPQNGGAKFTQKMIRKGTNF